MSFESARFLGRISTLLLLLLPVIIGISSVTLTLFGFFPSTNPYMFLILIIPSFLVYVLFLLAMNGLAKYYEAPRIFTNCLYAFVTSFIGGIILIIVAIAHLTPILDQLSAYVPGQGNFPASSVLFSLLQTFAIFWVATSIIAILNGFLYRRAFYALAEKSGEHNFKQAGLFMFIGGILTIVIVGGLIFFIGLIFALLGFFSIKPKTPQTYPEHEIRS